MAPSFEIPSSLRDLEVPSDEVEGLYAQDLTVVENLSPDEVDQLVRGVAYELAEKDVCCIEEQSIFDQVYSLVRGFSYLAPSAKGSLVESLCSNFAVLNPSITALSFATGESNEDAAYMLQQMHSHRNALKIYSYFLHCILVVEEAAEPEPVEKASRGKKKQTQPRKKHVPAKWTWEIHRTRIVRLLATALQVDLRQLYAMSQPEEGLIMFFTKTAFKLLEIPAYMKEGELKEALCNIVAACAANYGYLVPITSTIINLLYKFEHLPIHLADLVALADEKFPHSSLSGAVLREIGHLNPADFKRDTSGAENVGEFLVAMAERLPKLMTMNLSIIMPHLDGESYKMRNAIVQVIGKLVIKASKDSSELNAVGDEMVRLRSKQGMLDILLERARDQSAYTRSKVLQTWANLCEEKAVSMGHWNLVASIAAGRLEDKTSQVRKSALQLLTTLLQYNPFGPSLRMSPFEATLEQYKEKLQALELEHPTKNGEPVSILADGHETDGSDGQIVHDGEKNLNLHENNTQYDDSGPSQVRPDREPTATAAVDFGGLDQTRSLVASLESGLQFARCIAGVMDVLKQLLASKSSDDVKHTIVLLILARRFEIDGAEDNLRKMMPLGVSLDKFCSAGEVDPAVASLYHALLKIFSQEKSVSEAVEGAFTSLYMSRSPSETASNLINLTLDATIGDLASIEALISKFTITGDLSRGMISALWNFFTFNVPEVTPQRSRGALVILCMAAKSQPQILSSHIQSVMDIGLGRRAKEDPLLARYACIALQHLSGNDRVNLGAGHKIFSILCSLITGPGLPEESWYSAAEQAINAVYTLHPTPETFASSLLLKFAQLVFGKPRKKVDEESPSVVDPPITENENPGSPAPLEADAHEPMASTMSRFLFAVAHVALKHLVYIETCVRKVRKQRADKEKAAADVAADLQANGGGSLHPCDKAKAGLFSIFARCMLEVYPLQSTHYSEDDQVNWSLKMVESISAELGMAASEDARTDSLLEITESEIITGETSRQFLIGTIAPIVARICRNMGHMQQYPRLRSSAMLALSKLMAIDSDFCEKNLQFLFTVAQNSGETAVRSNCIIALGDLAFRFPNVLEPWTEHMYARLNDSDHRVRKNSVLVLTHLILNDMVKVKGHISEMVLRLEDEDERIQNLVKLFFSELSKKGSNPIYNLLPDILSRLSCQPNLPQDTFRTVMQFLIDAITKDKQREGLFEKLCYRFPGTTDEKHWRDLAYCLAQLSCTDKGLKKLIELFPKYQHALGDEEVVEHFKAIVAKAKKFAKPEVKVSADDFESQILEFHEQKKEHDLAMQNAQAHQQRWHEPVDSAHTLENGLEKCSFKIDAKVEDPFTAADVALLDPERVEDVDGDGSTTENDADEASSHEEARSAVLKNTEANGASEDMHRQERRLEDSEDDGNSAHATKGTTDHAHGMPRRTTLQSIEAEENPTECESNEQIGCESDGVESVAPYSDKAANIQEIQSQERRASPSHKQSSSKTSISETNGKTSVSYGKPRTTRSQTQAPEEAEQDTNGCGADVEAGSDIEEAVSTDTDNVAPEKYPHQKLPLSETSRLLKQSYTQNYRSQNLTSTEDYQSQRLTNTEDYRSQKGTDTEDYCSQGGIIEDFRSQEHLSHTASLVSRGSRDTMSRKVFRRQIELEDEHSQLSELSTDSAKEVSKRAVSGKVLRQSTEIDADQSQLSAQSADTAKDVSNPLVSRKVRKQVIQSTEDVESENNSIHTRTRPKRPQQQSLASQKPLQPVSGRRL